MPGLLQKILLHGTGVHSGRNRLWGGVPVFNGAVAFTLDHGTVTAVSGSLLPDTGTAAAEEQPLLSAFAALTAFQQMRHESSSVVSAITEISLCYELQSTAAAHRQGVSQREGFSPSDWERSRRAINRDSHSTAMEKLVSLPTQNANKGNTGHSP